MRVKIQTVQIYSNFPFSMDFVTSRIRSIRQQKRLSVKEISERLDIDVSNYYRWEKRGRNLTVDEIHRIAKILDEPVASILGINPEKQFIVAPIPQKPYTPNRLDFFAAAALQGLISRPENNPFRVNQAISIAVSMVQEMDKAEYVVNEKGSQS